MDFTFETLSGALNRIAAAKDATWDIHPEYKAVNLYQTYPEAALPTVTNSTVTKLSFTDQQDLTQVRTRVLFEGRGTNAAALVPGGATSCAVADTQPFLDGGGKAISGRSLFTYTGKSTPAGPGSLTGCTGILFDIAEGDEVLIVIEKIDSAAQTALATQLGGGVSGQATHYIQDRRVAADEADVRASADLAVFGGTLRDIDYEYRQTQRYLKLGRSITFSITDPLVVNGTFRIQSITMTPRSVVGGDKVDLSQNVKVSGFSRALTNLLGQLPG